VCAVEQRSCDRKNVAITVVVIVAAETNIVDVAVVATATTKPHSSRLRVHEYVEVDECDTKVQKRHRRDGDDTDVRVSFEKDGEIERSCEYTQP
jgi:hypothetical protein